MLAMLLDAQATEQKLHAPPLRVAAFYLVSGTVIGLAAGLVQPFLRTRAACLLFGFIIMIPVTAAGTTLVRGLAYASTPTAMAWTLLIALITGVIGGSILGPLR